MSWKSVLLWKSYAEDFSVWYLTERTKRDKTGKTVEEKYAVYYTYAFIKGIVSKLEFQKEIMHENWKQGKNAIKYGSFTSHSSNKDASMQSYPLRDICSGSAQSQKSTISQSATKTASYMYI